MSSLRETQNEFCYWFKMVLLTVSVIKQTYFDIKRHQ